MTKFSINAFSQKLGIVTGSFLPSEDSRGNFTRVFDKSIFSSFGYEQGACQINRSFSKNTGTLRGLHYQLPPAQEDKLIFCVNGAIFDVVVDVRAGSTTWSGHESFIISRKKNNFIIVPKGHAHGYQTIEDNTEIIYITTEYYNPALEQTINVFDPMINIKWPINDSTKVLVSQKDHSAPYLQ